MFKAVVLFRIAFVGGIVALVPVACGSSGGVGGGGGGNAGTQMSTGSSGSDGQTGGSAGSGGDSAGSAGSSGGSAGAAGGMDAGACPGTAPAVGSVCTHTGICSYGGGICCGGGYTCSMGKWRIVAAGCACVAPQDASVPETPPPDAPLGCGTQTCAPDEWCQYPCCGILPPCMPAPEAGTCSTGYASCFTLQSVKGCQYTCTIPSCSKQKPLPGCTVNGRQVNCRCG